MIQSWENLVTGGRTDGETDEQTKKSDFIGRSPTNVDQHNEDRIISLGVQTNYTLHDIFSLLRSHYVADFIKKLELLLMVVCFT